MANTTKEIKLKNIKNKIKIYANSYPHETYGMDELLNQLNVIDLKEFALPPTTLQYIELIKIKRKRILRQLLASPTIKPHQVAAIIKALEIEEEGRTSGNNVSIEIKGFNDLKKLENFEKNSL